MTTKNSLPVSADDVEEASRNLADIARQTPMEFCARLTEIVGSSVYLKREDLQVCRSFKARGAYNRISALSETERQAGIVCASAGNHAQGVANACARLGIHGTVFLPMLTPRQKRERIRSIGGDWVDLVFVDGSFDRTQEVALEAAENEGRTYIHPYDDPAVIAGQGSIALEIEAQLGPDYKNVLIPVGGGGLISGMAAWLKCHRPDVRIIGVESAGAASAWEAHRTGKPQTLESIDSFVDGTAVGRVGDHTFPLIEELVDGLVVVEEGAICTEMLDMYQQDGIIAEPAGAMASSALVAATEGRIPPLNIEGPVVAIVSGGNNDLSRYAEVTERSMAYRGLRHYFLITFPQQPGALRLFLDEALGPEDDIVFFEYVKKNNREMGPAVVGIDVQRPEDIIGLQQRMELAPLHIEEIRIDSELLRYLV